MTPPSRIRIRARDGEVPCEYPVLYGMGFCCQTTPCSAEWRWPCDAEGGCWDRSTCPGCQEPVWETVKPLQSDRDGEAP